ncbi:type VII secretion system-associated protein [Streptomyces tubercidicus]|uniref:type VII secretion system-associated protein n=1 Tax=Streptomyces tubercidicus TaxID=47759 RepID=UPI00367C2EDD
MNATSAGSSSSRQSDPTAPAAQAPAAQGPAATDPQAPAGPAPGELTALTEQEQEQRQELEQEPDDAEVMPPVPDHIREAARLAPDHWFGMIDPTWSGEGEPPSWAVVGQWRSDQDGEIAEWRDNEEYRPSPKALEWPDPTDPVDAAVHLAATGYGPVEAVTKALATAEFAVFLAPGGGLLSAVAPDDETPVVPVFTSPDHLAVAGRLSFKSMKAPELLDRLPEGHLIYLNASGPVSMAVETRFLRDAVAAAGAEGESTWDGDLDDLLPNTPAV